MRGLELVKYGKKSFIVTSSKEYLRLTKWHFACILGHCFSRILSMETIMLKSSQFDLFSVQAVLFILEPKRFVQSSFLASVLGEFATRYNGPLQAIPLPDDAPLEIPRVILQSADGVWKMQAGPARIDSLWSSSQKDSNNEDIVSQCMEVLVAYIRKSPSVRIIRLGLVINRIYETPNSADELIRHFCNSEAKEGPFRRSENFEIHNHKRYKLSKSDIKVNSWVRCKAATLLEPGKSILSSDGKHVILIEQDINILETNKSTIQPKQIPTFYKEAEAEMSEILQLYFPGGPNDS